MQDKDCFSTENTIYIHDSPLEVELFLIRFQQLYVIRCAKANGHKIPMSSEQTFTDHKIISPEEIGSRVGYWRKESRKLVFTNGCFDILHSGHVRYLQTAADFGDIFLLGLNSDSSVRKLKGPRRPIMTQADRAYILSAIEVIDYIVIFDEETPARLIQKVRPDVLVKGGDYLPEDVVGYDTVTKNGGCVKIVPFVKGKSTTVIVNSILEKS